MFADAEAIEADVLGQYRLVHNIAQDLRLRERFPTGVERDIAERIESEFKHVIKCYPVDLL
jgi:hypothetical protein